MALCLQPSLPHPSTQHTFSCATQGSSRPKQLIKQLQAMCVLRAAEKLGNDFRSQAFTVLRVGDKHAATTSRSFVVTLSYKQVSFSKLNPVLWPAPCVLHDLHLPVDETLLCRVERPQIQPQPPGLWAWFGSQNVGSEARMGGPWYQSQVWGYDMDLQEDHTCLEAGVSLVAEAVFRQLNQVQQLKWPYPKLTWYSVWRTTPDQTGPAQQGQWHVMLIWTDTRASLQGLLMKA